METTTRWDRGHGWRLAVSAGARPLGGPEAVREEEEEGCLTVEGNGQIMCKARGAIGGLGSGGGRRKESIL